MSAYINCYLILLTDRVGINQGFIIKPNPVGFTGFIRAGLGGFMGFM